MDIAYPAARVGHYRPMRFRVFGCFVPLTFGVFAASLVGETQQPSRVPRIGYLEFGSAAPGTPYLEAFRQGLRDLGWVEGQNIAIELRSAEGKHDRLPELAAELVRLKVDLIFASTTPAALAAKQATTTIPIVIGFVADPVGSGLVASLARKTRSVWSCSRRRSQGPLGLVPSGTQATQYRDRR